MKKWHQQFSAVFANSFVVLTGDSLTLIIHIFVISMTLLIACLPGFTVGGHIKLVRDQSMALTFMAGCLLAAVGAGRIISDDLRRGMFPTIMSRPVSCSALLAGKLTGLLAAILIIFISAATACLWVSRLINIAHTLETLGFTVYCCAVVLPLIVVAVRHYRKGGNYIWQANIALFTVFIVSFLILNFFGYNGTKASYGSLVNWNSAFAYLYIFMALIVFASVISILAVVMDVSMLMACAVILFFGGLFSGYIINILFPSPILNALCNTVIPNWQTYWMTEIISSPEIYAPSVLLPRLLNALLQGSAALVVAIILFERQEIKGSV